MLNMMAEMAEMKWLVMEIMPNPPRIPMAVKIGALLLVPPLDPFCR
jgi:hypothetical protein